MNNIFKGKLSYTLALLAIVGAGAGWYLGIVDKQTAIEMIWAGLGLYGIRRAIR